MDSKNLYISPSFRFSDTSIIDFFVHDFPKIHSISNKER